MAVLLPLLPCLLLGCVATFPEVSLAFHVDQESGSGLTPQADHLSSALIPNSAEEEQFKAELTKMIQVSVRQATSEAHSELFSRLGEVQSSLERLEHLSDRLKDVEGAITDVRETVATFSHQVKTQKTISSRQTSSQRRVTPGLFTLHQSTKKRRKRSTGLERVLLEVRQAVITQSTRLDEIVDLVPTREDLEEALHGLRQSQSGRLDGLIKSLAAFSDQQRKVQGALRGLPTTRNIQESLAVFSSRMDWTQTLEKITKTQEDTLQTLSSHAARFDIVPDQIKTISSGQQAIERTISAQSDRLEGAASSLSALSEGQQTIQRALVEQSVHLSGVAEAVSASRPGLVASRLLGELCRSDADCSVLRADTVCGADGRCQCAAGLQQVAGETCRPFPRLSEPCRLTSDCLGATELAVCADSRCVCPEGLLNFNDSECRAGPDIGEPCDRDSDCSTLVGLTCSAGVCAVRACDPPRGGLLQYRLVGGSSCSDGLIQFTFNAGKRWLFVCDSSWTRADAVVACRYLGFPGGVPLPWNSTMTGSDNFLAVEDYVCEGSESSLSRCRRVYDREGCTTRELAGVRCSEQ